MALFVVRHQHDPDRCPATDPVFGARLLMHMSRPNVARHGIEIRGEAVAQGEHALYLIVESESAARVLDFMAPFLDAGTVEVHGATTCAGVVASGGCSAPAPTTDDSVPTVDPGDACQRAIEEGLVVHRAHPLNAETSIPALVGGVVMPNAHFYVRNHFHAPRLNVRRWRLTVGGLVADPLRLSLHDLEAMPETTSVVTLECAGNGRALLDPPTAGEQWQLGAVSTAEWTGVALRDVLDRAGVLPRGRVAVFRGADRGFVEGHTEPTRFERSLTLDEARDAGALLAYAMNGEALPPQHGYPLRLIVPGWYAVASVKWLDEIEIVDTAFDGYFQTESYIFVDDHDGEEVVDPVTLQRVRALIVTPAAGDVVDTGELAVRGVAWSGAGPIRRVEVRVDRLPWQPARLVGDRRDHGWQWWELLTRIDDTGAHTIRARATDLAGRTQPDEAPWNPMGYGNNAVHRVEIDVR
jgi:DMSO/TMAO reductase YedYZ molybdopterin-dependent catalytic subunit